MPVLLLMLLWPLMEISMFILVGQWLGIWLSLLLVVVTAVVGVALLQAEWQKILMFAQQKLLRQETPSPDFNAGLAKGLAGVLLIVPGFISDLVALVLVSPFGKIIVQRHLKIKRTATTYSTQSHTNFDSGFKSTTKTSGRILEGEYERKN